MVTPPEQSSHPSGLEGVFMTVPCANNTRFYQSLNAWRRPMIFKAGKRLRRYVDIVIARYSEIPVTPVLDNRLLP